MIIRFGMVYTFLKRMFILADFGSKVVNPLYKIFEFKLGERFYFPSVPLCPFFILFVLFHRLIPR